MDNPQHYQPLSAALHPPLAHNHARPNAGNYGQSIVFDASGRPVQQGGGENPNSSAAGGNREEEEEEEEEEHDDEDDEGMIEKELNPRREGGSEREPVHGHHPAPNSQPTIIQTTAQGGVLQQQPERRRPGRPRGSKNRKNRVGGVTAGPGVPAAPAAPSLPPLPAHADINPHNREYYEFQWKVLHLCREFYEAAEQLVKSTHPLVIAQCYAMGPACKVDPIVMLAESKAVCDSLMANPAQLISNPHPPPPMYPIIPAFYNNAAANTTPGASTSRQPTALTPSTVITNPQSFVVPLGLHPPSGAFPPPPFGMFGAPPPPPGSQYATPYYGFPPYGHTSPYYQTASASTSTAPPAAQPAAPVASSSTPISTSNGPWTDEQISRLKELVEESKGSDGQVDWERVEKNLPGGRSRHQILIKATALGLKENTSRAAKRPRREQDQGDGGTPLPSLPSGTPQQPQPRVDSPHSQAASTPTASPALTNQQQPPSTTGNAQASASNARTGTPAGTWGPPSNQDPQRTSYYRPRPTSNASKSASEQIHHYQYTPNGRSGSGRDSSG